MVRELNREENILERRESLWRNGNFMIYLDVSENWLNFDLVEWVLGVGDAGNFLEIFFMAENSKYFSSGPNKVVYIFWGFSSPQFFEIIFTYIFIKKKLPGPSSRIQKLKNKFPSKIRTSGHPTTRPSSPF